MRVVLALATVVACGAAGVALADDREVVARNARRVERGEEPLDVEAETERRLRELGA